MGTELLVWCSSGCCVALGQLQASLCKARGSARSPKWAPVALCCSEQRPGAGPHPCLPVIRYPLCCPRKRGRRGLRSPAPCTAFPGTLRGRAGWGQLPWFLCCWGRALLSPPVPPAALRHLQAASSAGPSSEMRRPGIWGPLGHSLLWLGDFGVRARDAAGLGKCLGRSGPSGFYANVGK